MADVLFDFDNPSDATRSLKRVAQAMQRAGQPVVSHDFDPKLRRTGGIGFRQALLTLASGQTVTLMVKQTGDVYRVLLNGAVLPIKNQDGIKAIGEIAAAAERNQAKFQAAQARQKVALPKGIRTAAPKMAEALAQRNTELDAQIAEKTAERDALKAELGEALDSVLDAAGGDDNKPDWSTHDWPQIVQNNNGNWFGVKAGWKMDIHEDFKEGETFSLLSEDGQFLKRTKILGDWRQSLESRPVLDSVELQPWTADHEESLQLARSIADGVALDSVGDLSAAVATLQIALGTVENNAPINEAAGNIEQAALERNNAESFRKALAILDDASGTVLSDAALEVLAQVAEGPVEDGDVVSKAGRDELEIAGFIDRYTDEGNNVINDAGRTFLANAGAEEFEPAEGQDSLFGDDAA